MSEQKSVGRLDGWLLSVDITCDDQGKADDFGDRNFVIAMGKPNDEQRSELEKFLKDLEGEFVRKRWKEPAKHACKVFERLLSNFAERPQGLKGLDYPWSKFIEEQAKDKLSIALAFEQLGYRSKDNE